MHQKQGVLYSSYLGIKNDSSQWCLKQTLRKTVAIIALTLFSCNQKFEIISVFFDVVFMQKFLYGMRVASRGFADLT